MLTGASATCPRASYTPFPVHRQAVRRLCAQCEAAGVEPRKKEKKEKKPKKATGEEGEEGEEVEGEPKQKKQKKEVCHRSTCRADGVPCVPCCAY